MPEVVVSLPNLPPRAADSNKGDFGRVLVIAGSRGMSGAAVLCGSAALRGGAGLVRVATPAEVQPIVAAGNPCYTTVPLAQDDQGRLALGVERELPGLMKASDVVALGPGLSQSAALRTIVPQLLMASYRPVVLDADGLNAFIGQTEALRRQAPLIMTPHPGEFARLVGCDVVSVQANRRELALKFAHEWGAVLVLKGLATLVTDGQRLYQNTTGNPGMATGGTGDVLTGLIAALLGQGLEPFAAAQLGVYVHGLAGDLAREAIGEVALIATDLLQYLSQALRRVTPC